MSVESFEPVPIETFGSMVTCVDPDDLAIGLSPNAQDVEFYPGGVRTRPGSTTAYQAIGAAGLASITGLKSYVNLALTQRLLCLDSDGQIRSGSPDAALTVIQTTLRAGCRMKSITAYGAEFIALSDGKVGTNKPLQWNEANLDRISQCGPGGGVSVVNATMPGSVTIDSIANSGATRNANIATIKYTGSGIDSIANSGATRAGGIASIRLPGGGWAIGTKINVTGVSDGTFNVTGATIVGYNLASSHWYYANPGPNVGDGVAGGGAAYAAIAVGSLVSVAVTSDATFNGDQVTVLTQPTANTITYANNGANVGAGVAGGGTIATQKVITVGVHKVACFFITRTGYWTKFSPPVSYHADGASGATVTIPIGPANVVARGIAFTLADGAIFKHLESKMLIADNVTTSVTLTFSDTELGSALDVTYLQNLEVLNYCSAAFNYADRMFYLGEENGIPGLNNLGFEGGADANSNPLGWTPALAAANGGAPVALAGEWGDGYRITLAVTASGFVGYISQSLYQDQWTQTRLLQLEQAYTVRAKIRRSAGANAGRVSINAVSFGGGIATAGLQVNIANLTTAWQEYEAELLPAQAAIPGDLALRVYVDNNPAPAGEYVDIDEIRVLPSNQKSIGSRLRASKVGDPETIDGTDGFLMVKENDGQTLRAAFEQRNFLYLVKERGLHVTSDNGTEEPAKWEIEPVEPDVGTPSIHGVDAVKSFAIIANKNGAYFFGGAITQNISREIQNADPTKGLWDRVNWDGAGEKIWVKIDEKFKRVLFGVPLDGALECNKILYLDYSDLPGPVGALLTDPVDNAGRGRKWGIWNFAAASAAIVETSGQSRLFLGNSSGNGKIIEVASGVRDDSGAKISAQYDTAYLGGSGFGRRLFGYGVFAVEGHGTLLVKALRPGAVLSALTSVMYRALRAVTLKAPNNRDTDLPMNVSDNRFAFRFETKDVGDWFALIKAKFYTKEDPWTG